MLDNFALYSILFAAIIVFAVVNRTVLVDPRIPLVGLLAVIVIWCVVGGYMVLSHFRWYMSDALTLDLALFFRIVWSTLPWLLVGGLLLKLKRYPLIHDVSTDIVLPPQFRYVKGLRHTKNHPLEYDSQTAQLQRSAYPSIQPLFFDLPPSILLAAIEVLVSNESWMLHYVDLRRGVIEASESTPIIGFVDDIVIRVQASGTGSRVDIRSASRVGVSDLGVNASRIARFSAALDSVAEKLMA